jgi:CBS domain containing-hemolysin-like protein
VGELSWTWTLILGLPVLVLHLVSVTLTRALRTYSRSRLEEIAARRGHPERAALIAHEDERTERAAETLAVVTGLLLAALLGAAASLVSGRLAVDAVVAIALVLGGIGYVLAGIVGRVFAEEVLDLFWSWTGILRVVTAPLTFGSRMVEAGVYRLVRRGDAAPRPASVEVEIPADGEDPERIEAEIPESTRRLLQNAIELTRRDVSELMTPRSAIVLFPSSVSAREAARVFRETGKSRIPLFGENRDDILGILYAKDLFPRMTDDDDEPVVPRKLVRPAYCVPETKNAYDLLEEFRSKRTQIAIVLDEYGGVAGLITLEDLLEELVGTIDDEHDVPTPSDRIISLGASGYEVDASLPLEELNERLGLHLPTDGDFLTVGGFVFHVLGRFPEPGASFRYDGVEFAIVEVADHAIRRVRVNLQPADMVSSQSP